MDIPVLAQNLTAFLAPFLPYLVQAGVEAGKEAAKKRPRSPAATWPKTPGSRPRRCGVNCVPK